jgi:eukaryotic-like serine/threonine-protein kinase
MPRVLGGRYELGARIGSGGMAEIFEARDRRLHRRVAIKLLRIDIADPRARQRFENEARVAASLNHPNVVTIYDFGEDGARPYLVMQLVEGQSVAELLSDRGRLEPDEVVVIVDQILAALAAAHVVGVVHRDVKPSNILLAADGVAMLADFGIAKAVSDATQGLTVAGQLVGTATYLSPEQVSGQPATARSDLYAVGVVLFEMLVGEPPFIADTAIATALAHQRAAVPSLLERRAGVAPSLVAVVDRALQKDPDHRFVDAESMRLALSATVLPLADPTVATPATTVAPLLSVPVDQPQRMPNRALRQALIAAGALVALVVLIVVARRQGQELSIGRPSSTTAATPATTARTSTSLSTTTAPSSIDALIARIAPNPAAYGKKGAELLKKLQEVQRENAKKPGDRSVQEAADKAADQISEWAEEGELDPTIAAIAEQLLEALGN